MMGAAVVIVLVGLVFPITLLLLALVFDVLVVFWVALGLSRELPKRLGHFASHPVTSLRALHLHWPHA